MPLPFNHPLFLHTNQRSSTDLLKWTQASRRIKRHQTASWVATAALSIRSLDLCISSTFRFMVLNFFSPAGRCPTVQGKAKGEVAPLNPCTVEVNARY